jgi:hypothetical protein
MGLCSEVADDEENPKDHPALANSYVRCEAPFHPAKLARQIPPDGVEPFSSSPDTLDAWDITSLGE